MPVEISWLGHASFKLKGTKVIYTDPWKIRPGSEKADIICITHSHYDHMSPPDVKALIKHGTVIVGTPDCVGKLPGNVTPLEPGQFLDIGAVRIEAVPAYNPKKKFHPKANGWVGYIITLDGERIYQAGDTDMIPEMGNLGELNYALLPIGGNFTMDAAEAAKALDMIRPKTAAIPMHWGEIVGTAKDAEDFKKRSHFPVRILPPLK